MEQPSGRDSARVGKPQTVWFDYRLRGESSPLERSVLGVGGLDLHLLAALVPNGQPFTALIARFHHLHDRAHRE